MGKKSFNRSNRIEVQIHKLISKIIYEKIKDPRVKNVTITDVVVSKDLRLARIYFVVSNRKYRPKEVTNGFNAAKGYLKNILASKINLRYMPDIVFFYDNSFDYSSHINELLKLI